MERLFQIQILFLLLFIPGFKSEDIAVGVNTHLYGSVTLPCTFNFVSGLEDLFVSCTHSSSSNRKNDKLVHCYKNGQDNLKDQDIQFRGRTEMSPDLARGTLKLTLNDVGFADEGFYTCAAANKKGRGEMVFRISIDRLHADDPLVVSRVSNGKTQLQCSSSGLFKEPRVEWQDGNGEDLTKNAKLPTVTKLSDGNLLVESVLDIDVQTNVHYFCRVMEGRLNRSTRAVLSDGKETVKITDDL
ncbi:butyrophilin 9 [Pelobates cultripes]|uniref:Butyrophilin 9 n=1 Tax=Pelobates cultripes TaxID=61616 RepID=A0AAD1VHU9_PELCU|nr:butyrophilin 9 [Pelobates cultripes]